MQRAIDSMGAQLVEAQALLDHMSSAELGKIASTLVPAAEVGEMGFNSRVLLSMIRRTLKLREPAQ